ncbi:MAG: hypothetical protein SPK11_02580 [Bullifex sp.]|nr:hypothetical protein [Bullifex sp.]
MARTKSTVSLDGRIREAERKVTEAKARYDSAVSELKSLIEEKKELQVKELMREMEKSGKSFEEVIRLIRL